MAKSDRAKQFMPFAALKGYYDLVEKKERNFSPKKELSEDREKDLSQKTLALSRGDLIEVTYYHLGEYITVQGIVSDIDFTFRNLTLVKTKINFDDIYDINRDIY